MRLRVPCAATRQALWALGRLATRSALRHGPRLAAALAQPGALRTAPTRTLCNALYGVALLARTAGTTYQHGAFFAMKCHACDHLVACTGTTF